jgi:ubiquinone/menaquinone biosynthesis C-methylase UbiE
MDVVQTKKTYTPGYSDVAIRYMMRRHARRDAAFLLPRLHKGVSLLDCGCGPGTISVGLAENVAPGPVIGIDIEKGQIDLARSGAQQRGLINLLFEVASVYDLPFRTDAFDVVFSHALFEHLTDPAGALKEIRRVLRPGGMVGIASPDWGGNMTVPTDPVVDEAIELYKGLQAKNGGNPYIGRELRRLLEEGGFSGVRLTAMYDCYEDVELFAELITERIQSARTSDRLTEGGSSDSARIERLGNAFRQWAKQPGVLYAQSFVEAVGHVVK